MDLVVGSGCSGDEQEDSPSSSSWQHDVHNNKDKKSRHTSNQIQLLEAFFKECPHPNDDQKRQLSRDLGLDLKQIKFWFQNKRTQTKAQVDRADNGVLRAENERISCENYALKEALNNVICPACRFGEDNNSLESLRLQNAQLKLEREKLSKLAAKYTGKTHRHIDSLMEGCTSSSRLGGGASSNSMMNNTGRNQQDDEILGSSSCAAAAARGGNNKLQLMKSSSSLNNGLEIVETTSNNNKGVMMKIAARGLEEVYKLLRINEPLWMKPKCDDDDDGRRYMLDRSSYQKLFQLPTTHSSTHHFESSKHSALVPINSLDLVDAFLDSGKWSDLFPTIVTQAKTIQVLETGTPNNHRSGSVQLMYEEMHVLSPLVPSRQYYFLRSCQQIGDEAGLWVIADVSCSTSDNSTTSKCSWRLPSGCMIQDLSNGYSKVTWVEHIAEDKRQYGGLYRDILSSGIAYGAQRWVASLERQAQRLITMKNYYYLSSKRQVPPPPPHDQSLAAARNSRLIIKVAGRMVKGFCAALQSMSMTSTTEGSNMRVSVRQGGRKGDPIGTIISASTSLWLPIPHQQLINFLRQVKTRMQWDVLANGKPMYEVASISSDDGLLHSGNSISIMQPIMPVDNTMLLQEICTDKNTGSSILVYAPIDIAAFTTLFLTTTSCKSSSNLENHDDDYDSNTNNLERLSLLPLGFTICASDEENEENDTKISGSLLTAAFQMLVSSSSPDDALQLQTTMDCIATINVLLNSTINKIKAAFNSS